MNAGIKLSLRVLLVYALCGFAFAQPAQQPAAQPAPDKKKAPPSEFQQKVMNNKSPVQIEADNLEVFQKESKIVFTGKVILKQAPTTIQCRKLTAFYDEKNQEVKNAVCEGDVKVNHLKTFARCAKAIYDNVNGVITMEGAPVIYQENQVFRGTVLKYYLKEERITGTNIRYQRNPSPPQIAPKSP